MRKIELIRSYYLPRIGKDSEDYKILGWEDKKSQILRFKAFISNIDIKKYKSFFDVGCGVGTILDFFKDNGINLDYTGVDILPEMIDIAKLKRPGYEFLHMNVFDNKEFKRNFDIVYCSGIFNINLGNNVIFLENAIKRTLDFNPSILGFNLLHYKSPNKEPGYFYFSPEETIRIIEKIDFRLKKIKIIEGYLDNDFTIICEKG
ncbi:MAG TPA: class I SAM-dependent methyltransferase [Spirochaetota bacterium]|nr:class I SAM-dependent methyltransferase [Spirochaetota bacterium]